MDWTGAGFGLVDFGVWGLGVCGVLGVVGLAAVVEDCLIDFGILDYLGFLWRDYWI